MTEFDSETVPQFNQCCCKKKLAQNTYHLPCLVPCLLQLVYKLDATLEASVSFMLMFLKNYLELSKYYLPTVKVS